MAAAGATAAAAAAAVNASAATAAAFAFTSCPLLLRTFRCTRAVRQAGAAAAPRPGPFRRGLSCGLLSLAVNSLSLPRCPLPFPAFRLFRKTRHAVVPPLALSSSSSQDSDNALARSAEPSSSSMRVTGAAASFSRSACSFSSSLAWPIPFGRGPLSAFPLSAARCRSTSSLFARARPA